MLEETTVTFEDSYSFEPSIEWEGNEGELVLGIRRKEWDTWDAFMLRVETEKIAANKGVHELLAPIHLQEVWSKAGVILYPHQLETARRVVLEMRGRAILADEVGLGKTIEAGIILKEYLLRGLVRRFLILTPATLCRQWAAELSEKFQIQTLIARHTFDWTMGSGIIASIDTAKKADHKQAILNADFDMVIVDEAHKLKNANTACTQLVQAIPKKFFLLLTATPLQNDLKELFTLISLLRPGQLGSYRAFRQRYVAKKREPKNPQELREILNEVMVRNKRGPEIELPPRNVVTIPLQLTPMEMDFYQSITDFIREEYRAGEAARINPLTLTTLQREVCSSSFAAAMTLYRLASNCDESTQWKIVSLLNASRSIIENTKIQKVLEILAQTEDKFLIFTEFIATQEYIRSRLQNAGVPTLCFDGTMSASKKDWTRCLFRDRPEYRVMVCTEAGGQGINLQFCHQMINYDLPWNPMRVEQRIGRIHRLGQTREVQVYNLSTLGTIEEHLLNLLGEKLRMFQMVVGDLHKLNATWGQAFETKIMEVVLASPDQKALKEKMDILGKELENTLEEKRSAWDELL